MIVDTQEANKFQVVSHMKIILYFAELERFVENALRHTDRHVDIPKSVVLEQFTFGLCLNDLC